MMTDRVQDLAAKQAALQLRCAGQRRALEAQVASFEVRLRTVDRAAAITRRILWNPVVITAAAAGLVVLWRRGNLRVVTRGLLLAAGARRLLRTAAKL